MLDFILVIGLGITALVFLKIFTKTVLSISGIFIFIWMITLSLSCLGFYGMNPPNSYVVFLGIVSIFVFAIFGCVFGKRNNKNDRQRELLYKKCARSRPLSQKAIIYILTVVAYAYIFPFLLKSINLIREKGWSYLRYAVELESYGSTAQLMIMQYFVQSLFIVTILVVCIDLVNKKIFFPSLVVAVLDTILYATLFGGRYIFLYWLAFAGFLLAMRTNGKISTFVKKFKIVFLMLFIIVIAMVWLTLQRSGNTFFKSLYVYFCGSYSYLSYLIDESIITDMNFMGLNQIGFIYNFVFSGLTALFGFNYQGTNHIISQATSPMVSIGGSITYNALGTCLESFICDFGLFFAPIGLLIFAFLLNYIEYKYHKAKTSTSLGLYLIAVFVTINSVFGYSLGSPGFLVVLILVFIFAKDTKKSKKYRIVPCKNEVCEIESIV